MLINPIEKLRGYEYPDPSIEMGQTPANHQTPEPLSRANVEKLREYLRDKTLEKKDRDR